MMASLLLLQPLSPYLSANVSAAAVAALILLAWPR